MRFVCDITHDGNTVARMSCDPRPGEAVGETADRGKASLLRDAYRHGRETHLAIETIAEEYHRFLIDALERRESATLCVVASERGEVSAKLPGIVMLASRSGHPWNGRFKAMSDRDVAVLEARTDAMMTRR